MIQCIITKLIWTTKHLKDQRKVNTQDNGSNIALDLKF